MSFSRGFIPDSSLPGGRQAILRLLNGVAESRAWAANGILARDDRVFWREVDDGVALYYREEI